MDLTVVVPTFNESMNVEELVRRLSGATAGIDAEVIFVDDSTDDTPEVIRRVAAVSKMPVRLIHREKPSGGLGGAVLEGFRSASADVCLVMDGDLQHPPEDVPVLFRRFQEGGADVVVASRYTGEGTAHGLSGAIRTLVSRASTLVTKAMFPIRLRACSDPMTGFFLVDRRAIALETLQPRGFKILLEILARQSLRVAEVPFHFAERYAGASKASLRQGINFLSQLAALRFGKMSAFALIGALGAIANIGIVWALSALGLDYIWAAIIAAEVTIIANFLLIEHFVFREMRDQASGAWVRFAKSFAFNNTEAVIRIPVMALMVENWHMSSVFATALTLIVAFFARFVFHSLIVYAPRKELAPNLERIVSDLDDELTVPGEL
ncbi:glycosyltransferase [Microbacterium sp.]|uniref:glycosyltransferase n=1 Tax=Microbacterium sp. TaxID=51671 RepID=UPI0039E63B36